MLGRCLTYMCTDVCICTYMFPMYASVNTCFRCFHQPVILANDGNTSLSFIWTMFDIHVYRYMHLYIYVSDYVSDKYIGLTYMSAVETWTCYRKNSRKFKVLNSYKPNRIYTLNLAMTISLWGAKDVLSLSFYTRQEANENYLSPASAGTVGAHTLCLVPELIPSTRRDSRRDRAVD